MISNPNKDLIKVFTQEELERISSSIHESLNSFRTAAESLQPLFTEFAKALKDFPESSKILAEEGWYMPIDFNFGTANYLANELRVGNSNNVNESLVKYFDEELAHIENVMIANFPMRQAVLRASLLAHKTQNYYLSIPVFFAQSEGICKELTDYRFFKLKDNEPAIKFWLSEIDCNSILSALLEPLKIQGPLRKKQEPNYPTGLNRHDVLHGDSVDYGEDKINSYKALSLLNYLSETVYMAKKHLRKDQI